MDGFDAETWTVYEYHSSLYHGCKRCFPQQRDVKRNAYPDRTVNEVYEATAKNPDVDSGKLHGD